MAEAGVVDVDVGVVVGAVAEAGDLLHKSRLAGTSTLDAITYVKDFVIHCNFYLVRFV